MTATAERNETTQGNGLAVRWILFSLASVIAGAVVFIAIGVLFGDAPQPLGEYFFGTVLALIFGSALGFGQWLAMRKAIDPGPAWVLATFAGLLVGALSIFGVLNSAGREIGLAEAIVHALLVGIPMGTAQWLVLRRIRSQSGWWIPVTVTAWVTAEFVGRGMTALVGPPVDLLSIFLTASILQGIGFIVLSNAVWPASASRPTPLTRDRG